MSSIKTMQVSFLQLQSAYSQMIPVAARNKNDGTVVEAPNPHALQSIDPFLSEQDLLNVDGFQIGSLWCTDHECLRAVYNKALELDREDGAWDGVMSSATTENFAISYADTQQSVDWTPIIERYQRSVFSITKETNGHGGWNGTYWIVEKEDLGNGQYRYYGITNAHVADDLNVQELFYTVHVVDQGTVQDLPLNLVGLDHVNDMAVMWFDSSVNLETLPIDEDPSVSVGDEIFMMGNQGGGGVVPLTGVVNNTEAYGSAPVKAFQDDSASKHGNSGSPVFNKQGNVIALVNSGNDEVAGVGFNIYIKPVMDSYRKIQKSGFAEHGSLGMFDCQFISGTALEQMGVPDFSMGYSLTVLPKWNALYRAGIRTGDILLGYDGLPMPPGSQWKKFQAYFKHIETQHIVFTVLHKGRVKNISVDLQVQKEVQRPVLRLPYGYDVQEVDRNDMRNTFLVDADPRGVAFVYVGWDKEKDDYKYDTVGILYEINGRPIKTNRDVQEALNQITDPKLFFCFTYYKQGVAYRNMIQFDNRNYKPKTQ